MISTKIQLRFSDFDMGGHVHNAAYLNYFESARIGFFIKGLGNDWDWKKDGLILKKNTVEYNIPTFIEDEIRVEVSCNHIGSKSFTLTYSVLDGNDNLKAYGESIVVSFDYSTNKTIAIPEKILKVLQAHLV
jgi:acyl-CoA thioester hydrolase